MFQEAVSSLDLRSPQRRPGPWFPLGINAFPRQPTSEQYPDLVSQPQQKSLSRQSSILFGKASRFRSTTRTKYMAGAEWSQQTYRTPMQGEENFVHGV